MAQSANTPLDWFRSAGRRWWSRMRELVADRWALAELEVQSDINAAKRLGVVGGAGVVLALAGLPVLLVALGTALAHATSTNPAWWHLASGTLALLSGSLIAWTSWRTFRREFAGLRETMEELREDARWLRELAADLAVDQDGQEDEDA